MKIYTRGGDQGSTSLLGGLRVEKTDPRIGAFGTIDELNAMLGLARAEGPSAELDAILEKLQNQMFDLGAELATPDGTSPSAALMQEADVDQIETTIDAFESTLEPLTTFILPGGTKVAAALHLARCICRRAERETVDLSQHYAVRQTVLKFLNRTSDLLFVLARAANAQQAHSDVPWNKRS